MLIADVLEVLIAALQCVALAYIAARYHGTAGVVADTNRRVKDLKEEPSEWQSPTCHN